MGDKLLPLPLTDRSVHLCEGREMLMRLSHTRYTKQIETAGAETILSRWAWFTRRFAAARGA